MGGVLADQYSLCSRLSLAAPSSEAPSRASISGWKIAGAGGRSLANGDRLHLDQDFVAKQTAHLDQRARGRLLGIHILVAHCSDWPHLANVEHEEAQLDHVLPGRTCSLQRGAQIPENLLCLRPDVALADQPAVGIEWNLPGDVDDPAGPGIDDVAVTGGRRKGLGREEALAPGHAAMLSARRRPTSRGPSTGLRITQRRGRAGARTARCGSRR